MRLLHGRHDHGRGRHLKKNPQASGTEVMTQMQKHICRCGSYAKYQQAITRAVAQTGKARA